MQLQHRKKIISNEKNITTFLPRMYFVENGIIRTQDNLIFGTLKVEGVSIFTASSNEINRFDYLFHNLVTSLNDDFCIVGHVIRRKMPMTFSVDGQSKFTKDFNTKYRKQLMMHNYILMIFI